jgi:hypothetical protein
MDLPGSTSGSYKMVLRDYLPAVGHAGELIPMKERTLTAPFERLQLAPPNDEPPQAWVVARDGAVVEIICEPEIYLCELCNLLELPKTVSRSPSLNRG